MSDETSVVVWVIGGLVGLVVALVHLAAAWVIASRGALFDRIQSDAADSAKTLKALLHQNEQLRQEIAKLTPKT